VERGNRADLPESGSVLHEDDLFDAESDGEAISSGACEGGGDQVERPRVVGQRHGQVRDDLRERARVRESPREALDHEFCEGSKGLGRLRREVENAGEALHLRQGGVEGGHGREEAAQAAEDVVRQLLGRPERVEDGRVGRDADSRGGIAFRPERGDEGFGLRNKDDQSRLAGHGRILFAIERTGKRKWGGRVSCGRHAEQGRPCSCGSEMAWRLGPRPKALLALADLGYGVGST